MDGMSVDDPDDVTAPMGIAPSTTVAMSLRTFIAMLVGIVAVLSGLGGTYFALAGSDEKLAAKQVELEKRMGASVTKEDLRALRLDVREDLLNSVWVCGSEGGVTKCRPNLPPRTP
jgi:hypothetical protein